MNASQYNVIEMQNKDIKIPKLKSLWGKKLCNWNIFLFIPQ